MFKLFAVWFVSLLGIGLLVIPEALVPVLSVVWFVVWFVVIFVVAFVVE